VSALLENTRNSALFFKPPAIGFLGIHVLLNLDPCYIGRHSLRFERSRVNFHPLAIVSHKKNGSWFHYFLEVGKW